MTKRRNQSWLDECAAKREQIIIEIDRLRKLHLKRQEIVDSLNARGITTINGKRWTANNLSQVEYAWTRAVTAEISKL